MVDSRYPIRDQALLLLMYRHGLRVSEAASLKWTQIELGRNPIVHVKRRKHGLDSVHPLTGR